MIYRKCQEILGWLVSKVQQIYTEAVERRNGSERLPSGALAGDAESLLEHLSIQKALDGSAWRVCVGVLCL